MNNNNRGNNNNRRRGRGNNNNRPNGGGGQQLNRVDSRARGNAPQMLEKYRKLAHDAHLNGDRVTEEYYLQFADHYFRVIADTRTRQEEQRARRDDRWQENGEPYRDDGDDAGEYAEPEAPPYGEVQNYTSRREREERPRRDDRGNRADNGRAESGRIEEEAPAAEDASDDAGDQVQEQPSAYEPPSNPFTREARPRGLKPRREGRQPRREEPADGEPAGLDPSSLPPSIGAVREEEPAAEAPAEDAKPRRRGRKPKAAPGDAGGPLEAVG